MCPKLQCGLKGQRAEGCPPKASFRPFSPSVTWRECSTGRVNKPLLWEAQTGCHNKHEEKCPAAVCRFVNSLFFVLRFSVRWRISSRLFPWHSGLVGASFEPLTSANNAERGPQHKGLFTAVLMIAGAFFSSQRRARRRAHRDLGRSPRFTLRFTGLLTVRSLGTSH